MLETAAGEGETEKGKDGSRGSAATRTKGGAKPTAKPGVVDVSESALLSEWLSSQAIIAWAAVQTPLGDEDLRPYLFVAKDRKDYFGAASALGHLATVVEQLLGDKFAVQGLEADLNRLAQPEAAQVFEAVRGRIVGGDSFDVEPSGAAGLTVLVKAHPSLQRNLVDFLEALPSGRLGPWACKGWEGVLKEPDEMERFDRILEGWSKNGSGTMKAAASGVITYPAAGSMMGTSNPFGGQPGNSPLVPSWVGDGDSAPGASDGTGPDGWPPGSDGPPTGPPMPDGTRPDGQPPGGDGPPTGPPMPDGTRPDGQPPGGDGPPTGPPMPPPRGPIPPMADRKRFTTARNNFSRFARSGGSDRRSLGRAVSHYVSSSTGGARTAATRMGSSRGAGGRLLGFLSDVATRGADAALRTLDLDVLAGRPIEEIFLGLVDYVCPDGGSVDEGIAREAFIETIADLAGAGITDLDGLTAEQMQTVFELYSTNAIEARLCNDIGSRAITFPSDSLAAAQVQAQLHDFIQRGVADALAAAGTAATALTPEAVLGFVEGIYEEAFAILEIMGDAEGT